MKEMSPVERARKNKWKIGTVLRSTEWELGQPHYEYWRITAFGEYDMLGIRVNLPEYTTSGETVIPYAKADSWRKMKRSAEFDRKIKTRKRHARKN